MSYLNWLDITIFLHTVASLADDDVYDSYMNLNMSTRNSTTGTWIFGVMAKFLIVTLQSRLKKQEIRQCVN